MNKLWFGISAYLLLGCTSGGKDEVSPELVYGGDAAAHGAVLFRDPRISGTTFNSLSCATCHEAKAGDSPNLLMPGARLAGSVLRPSFWGGMEIELLRSINQCLYYFMLKDKPWTAEDLDAQAIYAYLESLPAEQPEAVPFTVVYTVYDVPMGDAQRGGELYKKACASCHGKAHSGEGRLVAQAPIMPEQTLMEHPSPKYNDEDRRLVFVEKVRHGGFIGYGGQMPPFSAEVLTDGELGDILSYLGVP